MNREFILDLANVLDNLPEPNKFDMSDFFHSYRPGGDNEYIIDDCGTPSCIAGWAIFHKNGPDHVITNGVRIEAREIMGIDYFTAKQLFEPEDVWYSQITNKEAALTLRRLAETGEVIWSDHIKIEVT